MRKTTIALVCGATGLILGMLFPSVFAADGTSYGEDRAQIEDLQARYLFALDFHDPKLYASTFTPDGVLDYGEGDVKGREAIVKVNGNKATSRSSWFHVGNDNPQRSNTIGGFGHYEDDLVKVNGQWFFTKRKIYNEGSAKWQYKGAGNPAW